MTRRHSHPGTLGPRLCARTRARARAQNCQPARLPLEARRAQVPGSRAGWKRRTSALVSTQRRRVPNPPDRQSRQSVATAGRRFMRAVGLWGRLQVGIAGHGEASLLRLALAGPARPTARGAGAGDEGYEAGEAEDSAALCVGAPPHTRPSPLALLSRPRRLFSLSFPCPLPVLLPLSLPLRIPPFPSLLPPYFLSLSLLFCRSFASFSSSPSSHRSSSPSRLLSLSPPLPLASTPSRLLSLSPSLPLAVSRRRRRLLPRPFPFHSLPSSFSPWPFPSPSPSPSTSPSSDPFLSSPSFSVSPSP